MAFADIHHESEDEYEYDRYEYERVVRSLQAKRPWLSIFAAEPQIPEHRELSLEVYLEVYLLRCSTALRSKANKTSMLRSRHILTIPIIATSTLSTEDVIFFMAENIPNHPMVRRHLLPPRLSSGLGLGVSLQLQRDYWNSDNVSTYKVLVESFSKYDDLSVPSLNFLRKFYRMSLRKMTAYLYIGCPVERKKCDPSMRWMARSVIAWICSTPSLPLPKQLPNYSLSFH